MKKKILDAIYTEFTHWALQQNFCCGKGCAICCTQNVTITALEGTRILDFCMENSHQSWLASKLSGLQPIPPPKHTTNEYVSFYLEGREVVEDMVDTITKCYFLENDICTIYPVRPFSCRCFASKKQCEQHGSALVPDHYISASTAVMQIIEHLGQFEYWGNMADVLLSLCDISSYRDIAVALKNPSLAMQARLQTLKAKPIPGFLFPEEDIQNISPLIDAIFQTKIGEKNIKQILNGQ